MTVKSEVLVLFCSMVAVSLVGCETTTTEKSNYALTDGKSESILDSRIKTLENEAVKYPLRSDLHYNIASLHAKKGDCVESAKSLDRAIAISPNEAKYHFHLGRLFLAMQDLDRAEREFRSALSLSKEGRYTGPHAALAWTLSLKKQTEAAIEEFEKCAKIEPENPAYYYWLGASHDMQGRREKAIHNFREYLARGGIAYRSKAVEILQSLGVAPADIPDSPRTSRNEDLFSASMDGEPKPAEVKPAEVKPAEVKPAEVKPEEVKPEEVKPEEVKPEEVKPGK